LKVEVRVFVFSLSFALLSPLKKGLAHSLQQPQINLIRPNFVIQALMVVVAPLPTTTTMVRSRHPCFISPPIRK
jgi:hypothetical protein